MDVNYMKEKLNIPEDLKSQLTSEELEMTLVQRYMECNGWDYPAEDDYDCDEYDMAVNDVKWFIRQLIDL